jgi:Ca-activated chloride channel family protein
MRSNHFGRAWEFSWTRVRPLFLLAIAGCAWGQDTVSAPDFRISVDVRLVMLNVSVQDKKGRTVPDLHERNFRLEEDGQLQTIRGFQFADTPVAVGLVVDSSQSMKSKRPEVAAATAAFARLSDPRDEVFIVNFNEKVSFSFPDRQLLATSSAELASALLNPAAIGRTALYDAVGSALAHIRTCRIERKVLLVISDGGDNASKTTKRDILQEAARSEVEIYTIGMFDEDDSDLNPGVLRKIAESSGGQSFQPKPHDAIRICERIARDIRTQYGVSYSPSRPTPCGGYHAIQLRVTADSGARLAARTRAGYTAQACQ